MILCDSITNSSDSSVLQQCVRYFPLRLDKKEREREENFCLKMVSPCHTLISVSHNAYNNRKYSFSLPYGKIQNNSIHVWMNSLTIGMLWHIVECKIRFIQTDTIILFLVRLTTYYIYFYTYTYMYIIFAA